MKSDNLTIPGDARLGELLVREHLITREQLEDALLKQEQYGTRLASSLVALGYANEKALVMLLSNIFGVPFALCRELYSAPQDVIKLLSKDLAFKYHVVPFKLEKNRLSLAMVDPADFTAIDEIGFITGYVVKPFIALDVHVSRAMAKFYCISSREAQYCQMAERTKMAVSVQTGQIETIKGQVREHTTEGAQQKKMADCDDTRSEDRNVNFLSLQQDMEGMSRLYASATSRDDVADAVCNYLCQRFCAGAMFIVRGSIAVGWRAFRNGRATLDITDLNLLLSKSSILKDAVESRAPRMAVPVHTHENRQIQEKLELPADTFILTIPVVMLNKTVAIVAVSADQSHLERYLPELQRIIRKAALAFEMLVIRNKILAI